MIADLYAQDTAVKDTTENNTALYLQYSYANSVYFAAGAGLPQGLRLELGYNFGKVFSFGIMLGRGDTWTEEQGTSFGVLANLKFGISSAGPVVYILAARGSNKLWNADVFTLINLGTQINIINGKFLRPEAGIDFTSKHISGGVSLLGPDTPEVTEDITRFSFHISMEIDLAALIK